MTGDRPYRTGVSPELALDELRKNAGTQFDGRCLNALVQAIDENAVDARPKARRSSAPLTRQRSAPREHASEAAGQWRWSPKPAAGQPEQSMPSQGAARLER